MTTHLNRERRIAGALFNNSNTTRACGLADGARTRGHSLLAVLAIALPLVVAVQVHAQGGGGGNVLPPGANSHGYSLDQMTKLMAFFDTSGNNPLYYPKTPFQILATPFGNPNNPTFTAITCPQPPGGTGTSLTGGNTFVVKSGTPFFVPIWQFDDSPPYISPFPAKASEAGDYVFGLTNGFGARNTQITVDGNTTPVGAPYLGGPVETPPLPDGGGTHHIVLGVFLTPMSTGTHTVTISGELASYSFFNVYEIYYGGCLAEDITYTVKVVPGN